MTSQKSLNDKVNSNDIKRCFRKILPFTIIAFVVLLSSTVLPVLIYANSTEFFMSKASTPTISDFGMGYFGIFVPFGMFACGVLMSVTLFSFLFKKNSVNVYLSLGIKRSKLFMNRLLISAASMLAAVVIPLTITLILNYVYFGVNEHILQVYIYLVSGFFVSGLGGFSFATLICVNSGSLIETIVTLIFGGTIAARLSTIVGAFKLMYLNGYVIDAVSMTSKNSLLNSLNPTMILVDMDGSSSAFDILLFERTPVSDMAMDLTEKTVPDRLVLDLGLMLPIIIWAAISVLMLIGGYIFLNRRKAENSNSFGKFAFTAALNGTAVATYAAGSILGILALIFEPAVSGSDTSVIFDQIKPVTAFIFTLLISVAAYFVTTLIITRKIKKTVRLLPFVTVALCVIAVSLIYINTECFGSYNKLPATSEIKSVQMDIKDESAVFDYDISCNTASGAYASDKEADIKLGVDYFEKARTNEKDDTFSGYIGFKLTLKDGREIYRRFRVYDEKLYENYQRDIFASDYFKGYMKYLVTEPDLNVKVDDDYYGGEMDFNSNSQGSLLNVTWFATDSSFTRDKWSYLYIEGFGDEDLSDYNPIDNNAAFLDALYKDLSNMSYDEYYHSTVRPVAAVSADSFNVAVFEDEKYTKDDFHILRRTYASNYYDDENTKELDRPASFYPDAMVIFVYPQMTNTINFLNENGCNVPTTATKIKYALVSPDSKSACTRLYEMCKERADESKMFSFSSGFMFGMETQDNGVAKLCLDISYIGNSSYFGYKEEDYSMTAIDMLNTAFNDSGAPLIKVDAAKAEKIREKSVPFYLTENDEGRYVYYVLDNGAIINEYLPEKNIDILK